MKYIINHTILLVSMIVISCNQTHNAKDNPIIQITNFEDKTIELTDVIAETKVVPLLPDSNFILGHVKDLCIVDNTIYVLDDITGSVFLFTADDGKFITCINRRGNGPNEYIGPIAISANKDQIYLLDLPTMSLICFDKQINAQKTIRLQSPTSDFIPTESGFLFYNLAASPEVHRFIYSAPDGKKLKSFVPFMSTDQGEQQFDLPNKKFVKGPDNRIFASESFSNDIYEWNNDQLELICRTDFGDLNIPQTMNPQSVNLFDEPYAFNNGFFVFPELILTSFFYKSNRYYDFINLKNGNQRCGIVKDKNNDLPFFPQWQHNNSLIGVYTYGDLETHISKNPACKDIQDRLIGAEKETTILLFYELKQ